MKQEHGLGRGLPDMGLSELLSNMNKPTNGNVVGKLLQVDINALIPGKYQPRQQFNEEALLELSQSIKSQGIIQPLIVRLASMNTYEIIAGERRWRAAKMAGLSTLPIVIKEIDTSQLRSDYEALDEINVMSKMENQYIVKYYDSFISHSTRVNIVMEHCEHGDLH